MVGSRWWVLTMCGVGGRGGGIPYVMEGRGGGVGIPCVVEGGGGAVVYHYVVGVGDTICGRWSRVRVGVGYTICGGGW